MSHSEDDLTNESRWRELDDTLLDGPSPADVPGEARQWLADQRMMHGLLRAVNTVDATAREARVESVLASIDQDGMKASRHHWLAVAAAALILATVAMWIAAPSSLPTAEAAIARVINQMSLDVDRKFHIKLSRAGRRRPEKIFSEFDLTVRPGMRFLIEGRLSIPALDGVKGRVGCDGQTLWSEADDGSRRRHRPLSNGQVVLDYLGGILDGGYLDLHSLIERMPDAFELQVSGRSDDASGRPQLHIEARRRGRRSSAGFARWRSAELTVDEMTGLVTHLDVPLRMAGGSVRHVLMDYLGQPAAGAVDYSRPW